MTKLTMKTLSLAVLAATTQASWATCKDIQDKITATGSKATLLSVADGIVTANQPATAATGGGFGLDMWVTVVDETGLVCQVVSTARAKDATLKDKVGNKSWLGSRVISAQKANTANAFSLTDFAISTANLYGLVLEDGSLYGLQHSNPVDASKAYIGSPASFGTGKGDPLAGKRIGGVNVFGGGLALYKSETSGETTTITKVGAIGVSGDTSCTDHAIAWRIRHALGLDHVKAGFKSGGSNKGDEMELGNAGNLANTTNQPGCDNSPTAGTDNGVIDSRSAN